MFNILHNTKSVIKYTTKQLLFYKNSAVKNLTENAIANNSATTSCSSIANFYGSKNTKDQSIPITNSVITAVVISDKNKTKNDTPKLIFY